MQQIVDGIHFRWFKYLIYSNLIFYFLGACQPKIITQLPKVEVQDSFTCQDFQQLLRNVVKSNQSTFFAPSKYDNSSFPYLIIEPGQYMIQNDSLFFRLHKDINYEEILDNGNSVLAQLYEDKTPDASFLIGTTTLTKSYYQQHRNPYFAYKFALDGHEIQGKQLTLLFSHVDSSLHFNNTPCEVSTSIQLACCNGEAWKDVDLKLSIALPKLEIAAQTYHYAGFTGVLDITFDNNSSAIQNSQMMLDRVQNQINRFKGLDYKIEQISISGYASINGDSLSNQQLSASRAEALYKGLVVQNPNANITYEGKGEDWKLTKKLLAELEMDDKQKQKVRNILTSSNSDDEKEQALISLNLGGTFWEDILAPTRHTIALLEFSYQGKAASLTAYPDSLPLESSVLEEAALWQIGIAPYEEGANVERQLEAVSVLLSEKPSAELYAIRASYLIAINEYEKALQAIKKAEELEGTKWRLFKWAFMLNAFDKLSTLDQNALTQELKKATQENNSTQALAYMAVLQTKLGNITEALDNWQKLKTIRSLDAEELNNIAILLIQTQQLHSAEDHWQAARLKDPNLAEAQYNLAVLWAYRGFTEKAAKYIHGALELQNEWLIDLKNNPAFEYVQMDARFEGALEQEN